MPEIQPTESKSTESPLRILKRQQREIFFNFSCLGPAYGLPELQNTHSFTRTVALYAFSFLKSISRSQMIDRERTNSYFQKGLNHEMVSNLLCHDPVRGYRGTFGLIPLKRL